MEEQIFKLTDDQQKAYDLMMSGVNCYISGEAGTGKSYVLNKFIEDSRNKNKKIVVTAPTGLAADNVGGLTIHRAFGYPTRVLDAVNKVKEVKGKKVASDRLKVSSCLKNADIIVVDEISAVRVDLFELIATQILDVNAENKMVSDETETPYKPIQFIVVGDFSQTKPVVTKNQERGIDEGKQLKQLYPNFVDGYAFESLKWNEMNFEIFNMKEVIRQKDKRFSDVLKYLKAGDTRALEWLNRNIINKWDGESIVICGTNKEVLEINNRFLSKLSGKEVVYKEKSSYVEGYSINNGDRRNDIEVKLKVGAKVMSIVNDKEKRFNNGSRGIVTRIFSDCCYVLFEGKDEEVCVDLFTWIIKTGDDEIIGNITQIPLKLAYAITVHKVQGQTFDKICLKPECYFEVAMHYVAVSRATSLEGIQFYDGPFTSQFSYTPDGKKFPIKLTSKNVLNFMQENNLL